jgi:ankyrin repeat protein
MLRLVRPESFVVRRMLCVLIMILGSGCGHHESRYLFGESEVSADIPQRLSDTESLQLEIQRGDETAVLQRISEGLSVDHRIAEGRTLLMEASRWGRLGLVRELLARGANPSLRDPQGLSARDFAQNYPEILRLLPTEISAEKLAELFELAKTGEWRKLKAELDQGLDVNLIHPASGDTLLISASRAGARGVVGMLIRYPGCNLNLRSLDGLTALGAARASGQTAIAKDLQARGAID